MIKISKIEGRWQNFFSEADRLLILNSQDMHFGRLVGSASLNRANAFGIVPGTQRSSLRPMPCTPQGDADPARGRSARHRAGPGLESSARSQACFAQSLAPCRA